jgi:hypothetical protein
MQNSIDLTIVRVVFLPTGEVVRPAHEKTAHNVLCKSLDIFAYGL